MFGPENSEDEKPDNKPANPSPKKTQPRRKSVAQVSFHQDANKTTKPNHWPTVQDVLSKGQGRTQGRSMSVAHLMFGSENDSDEGVQKASQLPQKQDKDDNNGKSRRKSLSHLFFSSSKEN